MVIGVHEDVQEVHLAQHHGKGMEPGHGHVGEGQVSPLQQELGHRYNGDEKLIFKKPIIRTKVSGQESVEMNYTTYSAG